MRRRRKRRKTLLWIGNFWVPMARTEQGDEEANCSARLNKGDIVEIQCHSSFRGGGAQRKKNNGQITRRS
jgi:hypothetical protein